jgi:hypothetical protein
MSKQKISIVVYVSGGTSLIVLGVLSIIYLSFFISLGCILLGAAMLVCNYYAELAKYCAIGGVVCLVLGAILLALSQL